MIHCPCYTCGFRVYQTRQNAYDHLLIKPFPPSYTYWLHHGERRVVDSTCSREIAEPETNSEFTMRDMVCEAFNFPGWNDKEDDAVHEHFGGAQGELPYLYEGFSPEASNFHDLLRDGEQELYPGCSRYSKLSFLVRLYHIKCLCGVTDKAFGMILELLGDAFEHAKIPSTAYDAKLIIRKLGIKYKKIDACPNDYMLYRGNDQNLTNCKRCGTSRWKQKIKKNSIIRLNVAIKKNGKPQAAKTLRYFPLIPRLQRLFMSGKTSTDMLWPKRAPNSDGFLRHPRDAEAWKAFDASYTTFSGDPRSQQPHEEATVASSTQRDAPLIPSTSGGVPATTSCRPFCPPRSEIGPNPQSNAEGNQNHRIDEEEVNPLANEMDSFDDHADRSFEASNARNSRGRRNAKPWTVDVIEADGTIKESNMTVAQAMKPLHGAKVVLQFDSSMQPIGDSGGLLSGVLGVETFYFVYQNETIKGYMLRSLGKSWKEARNRLFHNYYDPRNTLEQNVIARPRGIDENPWRRFLRYRLRPDTKGKCRKNTANRSKQLYTHTGGSKSMARWRHEESRQ